MPSHNLLIKNTMKHYVCFSETPQVCAHMRRPRVRWHIYCNARAHMPKGDQNMVHNATSPKQDVRICEWLAAETRVLSNRDAWHTIAWRLQELGFQGSRMVQMRDAAWRARQSARACESDSTPKRDRPLDPVLHDMLRWLAENHPSPDVAAILRNAEPVDRSGIMYQPPPAGIWPGERRSLSQFHGRSRVASGVRPRTKEDGVM